MARSVLIGNWVIPGDRKRHQRRLILTSLSLATLLWANQPRPLWAEPIETPPPGGEVDPEQACAALSNQTAPTTAEAVPGDLSPNLAPDPNPLALPTDPAEVTLSDSQPLSLEQALTLADQNNPSLQASRLQLEQSQAALNESLAALYPSVDLNASLVYLSAPPGLDEAAGVTGLDSIPTLLVLSGSATANYDISTAGRRQATIQAAQLTVRQQELALEQAQASLRLDTTNLYYDLQETVEQIRISQAALTASCRNLRDTQLFFKAEVGTHFDVLRAEVQVSSDRQDLTRALSQWQIAQRQLAAQLNLPPSINVITTQVTPVGTWPLSLEDTIVLAWQNRAELEQPLVQRDIGSAQEQIALAGIRPQIQAFADVGSTSLLNASAEGISNVQGAGALGTTLNWRIVDGGAAAAQTDQARSQIDVSDQQYSQTRNQIRVEVEQAYYTLQSSSANIDTARQSVEQAKEALRLARRRFDAGVGDQLEVLVAQRQLTAAEGNLVSAILGYNRSLASLQRAVSNLTP